jgi:hypothetical protein
MTTSVDTIIYFFIFAVMVTGIAVVLSRTKPRRMICQRCGTIARPKDRTKGSAALEVFLWLCFLLPGLIYTAMRSISKAKVCPACASTELVPLDSPVGRELRAKAGRA